MLHGSLVEESTIHKMNCKGECWWLGATVLSWGIIADSAFSQGRLQLRLYRKPQMLVLV